MKAALLEAIVDRGFFRQQGVTLIELMVVVLIVGILSVFAYPNYQNHVERGRVSEGRVALTSAANLMERCYSTRGTYADCPALDSPIMSDTGFYSVDDSAADANTFTLQATRAKATGSNQCGNLTLTQSGATDVTGTAPWGAGRCWGK
ncbi:MAG: type IV pilus assembly protein PilE [Alcanivorax sp.]|uniref:type IV pilin protein n=1 Tax=Alcanivorax sp. TaxID=1872427 RepID=UPI0039E65D29